MNEWISVEDRLPNETGSYLIYVEGSYISSINTAFFIFDERGGVWKAAQAQAYFKNVTHWMPMPKPPTGKDDNND